MNDHSAGTADIRQQIRDAVGHLAHVLPGQAPIRDFVHHNTLHGFQHLPFAEALAEARRVTGNRGYLPPERLRALFAEGRISRDDLAAVLDEDADLAAGEPLADAGRVPLRRRDIYLAILLHPLEPITVSQLNWQIGEADALAACQPDVDVESRRRLLASAGLADDPAGERAAIADLWAACLALLGLDQEALHPEDLVDLAPEEAARLLSGTVAATEGAGLEREMRMEAAQLLEGLLARVGSEIALGGLLRELTGVDLLEQIRPPLVRHLAAFLDEGFAAWRNPAAGEGFYRAWRAAAQADLTPVFRGLHAWDSELESLPDDPLEAILAELRHMGVPRERKVAYLERLALELPGWSGMTLWRHQHPGYRGLPAPVSMLDYLAVRLVMERIYAQRLCRERWQIEASLDMLRWYFRRNPDELTVRHALYANRLPEYLASRAQRAATGSDLDRGDPGWRSLALLLGNWRRSPAADRAERHSVQRSAWPLFRLAQHLGLCADDLRALGEEGVGRCFEALELLDQDRLGNLWLRAYERHYRDQVLAALAANRGRGRFAGRSPVPAAQVVFCMDDREEGIRRHLEELRADVETLGAAAHFSVPHNWRGLDDLGETALAPVIPAPVIPAHRVREVPRQSAEAAARVHERRRGLLRGIGQWLLQRGRQGLIGPTLATAAGPLAALTLAGRLTAPAGFQSLVRALRGAVDPAVATRIDFVAPDGSPPATPEAPRAGYTEAEQAERVEALLRSTGLTGGFSPLVAILGHGSRNQNNPHASAYNCGACSGRFSGPNARLVAAMANRPRVRRLLAERGIPIPEGTWFVGGEHDTCDDTLAWYDLPDVPAQLAGSLARLREVLDAAARLHAQERSRRFASAPAGMDPARAHRHVADRAQDIAQVRPELGHATNACAFFGRRAMSRGAFFDRRAFLISYDPTQDPNGDILERHLVINGAVGAGISLEYYFSAANDEGFGCGSKVTHNVAGLLGVMDGAASDLRTGLPRQMVEIHEAMRLLVVVEQSTAVLTAIYERQPAVRELVGNAWVQLAALDPDDGSIQLFRPAVGWLSWHAPAEPVRKVARSPECYLGRSGPVPPALVVAPDEVPG